MIRLLVKRALIGLLAVLTLALPLAYYRYQYNELKRVRVVTDGRFYRSGQLTPKGFTEVVEKFGIRTIVNLQDEDINPSLGNGLDEAELCRRLGVNFVFIPPKLVAEGEPVSIEQFLAVCDDKNAYPILIHCKAGLHRTGTMTAFYRIEYEGWTPQAAMRELQANGFSQKQLHIKNPYIKNYLLDYIPRNKRIAMKQRDSLRVEAQPTP